MNNYIINPSVFYWINVMSILQTMLAVIGGFILTGSIALAVTYIYKRYSLSMPDKPEDATNRYEVDRYRRYMKDYEEDVEHIGMIRKWLVATTIIGAVLVLAAVFIPGKAASVEMMVARTATFENVDWTVQQVKEIIDYIVSALKGMV